MRRAVLRSRSTAGGRRSSSSNRCSHHRRRIEWAAAAAAAASAPTLPDAHQSHHVDMHQFHGHRVASSSSSSP